MSLTVNELYKPQELLHGLFCEVCLLGFNEDVFCVIKVIIWLIFVLAIWLLNLMNTANASARFGALAEAMGVAVCDSDILFCHEEVINTL